MQLKRIFLHDFRNYQKLELHPAGGLCVFTGENAAGKTNILESLFLCALGRSHRTRPRFGNRRALPCSGRTAYQLHHRPY